MATYVPGDVVRRISPQDNIIIDANGNTVGIQAATGKGESLRLGAPLTAAQVAQLRAGELSAAGGSLAVAYPFPKTRKALGDVLNGVADMRVSFVGDSTTGGLTATTGLWAKSPTAVLAKLLAARGIPVNANAAFCDQTRAGGATFTNWDLRFVLDANWSVAVGGFSSIGGSSLQNTAGVGTMSITPTDPATGAAYSWTTADVYYAQNTAYGSFTLGVNGGVAIGATVNCAGARQLAVASRSTTLGAQTLNINATVAGQIYIIGVVFSNSAQKAVRIFNQGGGSYKIADYAMGTVGDFTTMAALTNNTLTPPLAPHLVIFDIGINDRRVGLYTPAWKTSLEAIVARFLAVGSEIILCKPIPSSLAASGGFATQANQDAFDTAIVEVANANGLYVYDKRARLRTFELANPLGYYTDDLHLGYGGYAALADDLLQLLML